jgi:tRNA(fMet)-specific endonuclease VapC
MNLMLILDTDHLSVLEGQAPACRILELRLEQSGRDIVSTIISAEEQLRGWLARLHGLQATQDQVAPYAKLQQRLEFYSEWTLLPWTVGAADRFVALRKAGVRIGTMDLKIAAIALEHDAMVLSQNLTDFLKVPDQKVECWV